MKATLTLNGVTVVKDIPTTWPQVKYKYFPKLAEANDMAKRISVFTDIDHETIRKAKIKNYEVLASMLTFLDKEMDLTIPTTILGYHVPRLLEDEAAARYGDIQEIVSKFREDDKIGNLNYLPLIVATYVTPSPYNFKEAEILAEKLLEAPCTEVVAIGNFTLLKYRASKDGMLSNFRPEGTPLNRLKLAMINFISRLVFSIRYGFWKMSLPSPVKNFLNGL